MKRTRLRPKEVSKLLNVYAVSLTKKDRVELVDDAFRIILVNKLPSFFYYQSRLVPTLKYLQLQNPLKKITVDPGAVKFIVNGADILRPGITQIEDGISKDEVVVIVGQSHNQPLAVGLALFNSGEITAAKSGKMIKNIHYVGDKIWKFEV